MTQCASAAAPHIHTHTHACTHTYARAHMSTHTYACAHAHTCTQAHMHTHMCMHRHTHAYARTHTHSTEKPAPSLCLEGEEEVGGHPGALSSTPVSAGQGGGSYRLHIWVASASGPLLEESGSRSHGLSRRRLSPPAISPCAASDAPPSTWVVLGGGSPMAETTLWSGAAKMTPILPVIPGVPLPQAVRV